MKEMGQYAVFIQKSLKIIGIATIEERMKQIDSFNDIKVKPRKRVLEILVNEN